ncbi:MAG: hypothetical protein ACKESB_00620 [Candidatus Hodgkinia cicadicola]
MSDENDIDLTDIRHLRLIQIWGFCGFLRFVMVLSYWRLQICEGWDWHMWGLLICLLEKHISL